jgi:hypothetical protein
LSLGGKAISSAHLQLRDLLDEEMPRPKWPSHIECWSCFAGEWREIGSSEKLRRAAARTLKTHVLGTSDALQLGAAIIASGFEPYTARFVAEDKHLRKAADHEGFLVG